MNKLFIIISICFAATAFGAEADRKNPLTAEERALVTEIKDMRQAIHAKRAALLAMLEKDHPKAAAKLREHMQEAKQRHDERGERRQERRGQKKAE
jgi:hypothetical protein